MSLSPLEKLNNPVAAPQTQPPSQDALRRVAAQFDDAANVGFERFK
jgi:hypothetical protein